MADMKDSCFDVFVAEIVESKPVIASELASRGNPVGNINIAYVCLDSGVAPVFSSGRTRGLRLGSSE